MPEPGEPGVIELIIRKAARTLVALRDGEAALTARIGLGSSPLGPKQAEGDGHTPEGEYVVCTRNANSSYHLALGLSYPNADDAARALREERISAEVYLDILRRHRDGLRPPWDTPLGGFIMIHGGGASDWTAGCIALENEDMDALWDLCPLGTRVTIDP